LVVQEITLQAPDLVRRLIIDAQVRAAVREWSLIAQATGRLFGATPTIRRECLARGQIQVRPRRARRRDGVPETHASSARGRDPEVNDKVSPAQVKAIVNWGVQKKGPPTI